MNSRNLRDWAKALTRRFLKTRPDLEERRDDLEQEAALSILNALALYNPKAGMDKKLFVWFKVRNELKNFSTRQVQKHWTTPDLDPESPYWDLEDIPEVEEIPSQDSSSERELWDMTYGVEFTEKQQVVLDSFLETGEHKKSEEILGIPQQRISEIYSAIIKKIKKANDL